MIASAPNRMRARISLLLLRFANSPPVIMLITPTASDCNRQNRRNREIFEDFHGADIAHPGDNRNVVSTEHSDALGQRTLRMTCVVRVRVSCLS